MKIEIEAKDAPKYRRISVLRVDQSIHKGLDLYTLVSTIKKEHRWAKIIDIRIDLR